MPVFYFEIVDGQFHEDPRDLPDRSDVEPEIRRHLSEIVMKGDNPLRALIKVRNERRELVASASISAAIDYAETHH